MADRFSNTPLAAQLSLSLETNQARPFHRVQDGKIVQIRGANPDLALQLTDQVLKQYKKDKTSLSAIAFHECCRLRAQMQAARGDKKETSNEIKDLVSELKRMNVKQAVLDRVKTFADSLK